ncbi:MULTISPECIES: hypothetical protein [Halobacterium]|uniref:hypothetical protein n=1 Tax=Halobacterium TaxID=2239 RepID=UPI0019663690|nr:MULTISPECIES: hypothetical protein [Halobacterium]MDL0121841.1 hypothetical protein [Halobacterium salinarum]MDL0124033.1 hypothetical protein [Halobacterium salinarum]QRY25708.1 hypothetical protein JRZ79_04705 [Halobacterium sp. BOL4-2]
MRRFAGVVLGGVLAQAAILGTFGQLSPHHPGAVVVAFRVSTTGLIGGYVAAALGTHHPLRTATAAGASAGVGVGVAFWWTVLYGDTVGVFHQLHYVLATAPIPGRLVRTAPRAVAAVAALLVAAAFTAGGYLGGWMVATTRAARRD